MSTAKVNDVNLDFDDICNALSNKGGKYLAISHMTSKRDHTHVYVADPVDEFGEIIKDLNKEFREEQGVTQGPWKISRKRIEPDFLNYMVKEDGWERNVKAKRGFTMEQLQEAHEASDEYRRKLKLGLREHLAEYSKNLSASPPENIHHFLRLRAIQYYISEDKCFPPQLRHMILFAMASNFPDNEEVIRYVAEKY